MMTVVWTVSIVRSTTVNNYHFNACKRINRHFQISQTECLHFHSITQFKLKNENNSVIPNQLSQSVKIASRRLSVSVIRMTWTSQLWSQILVTSLGWGSSLHFETWTYYSRTVIVTYVAFCCSCLKFANEKRIVILIKHVTSNNNTTHPFKASQSQSTFTNFQVLYVHSEAVLN